MPSPLDDLIVDGVEIVQQKLAEVLRGRVGLEPNRDAVHLTATDASANGRVLLAILGRMALALVKPGIPGRLQPREVAEISGVNPSTVRPALRRFASDRVVAIGEDGGYYVPLPQLDRAISIATRGSGWEEA